MPRRTARRPGPNAPLQRRAEAFVAHWLGEDALAPFTGQDSAAFDAWCYLLATYAVTDSASRGALGNAMSALLRVPQKKNLPAFKQAIGSVLDWTDIDRVWDYVGGPDVGPISYGHSPAPKASTSTTKESRTR